MLSVAEHEYRFLTELAPLTRMGQLYSIPGHARAGSEQSEVPLQVGLRAIF